MGAKRVGVYGLLITLAGVAFFIVGLFGLSPTEQNEQNRQNEQNEQNVKEFSSRFFYGFTGNTFAHNCMLKPYLLVR